MAPHAKVAVFCHWALVVALLASNSLPPELPHQPQEGQQDATRGLWDKKFLAARNRKKRPARSSKQRTDGENELIGVTIWRLRNDKEESSPDKPRLLEQKPGGVSGRFLAGRVKANTVFTEGQMLRIGIEVPRNGYLYVIDREVYADGSMSVPYLIFPTTRTRGGNNLVFAGKLIEIPAQTDNPPYFTVTQSRGDQVSERLTIIVSPQRLNLPIRDKLTELDPVQISQWEKEWAGKTELREANSSEYKEWTIAEKEAAEGKRLLQQSDPLPQTIYRIAGKPGAPLLATIPLRIAPR
jgi:hypothetical protein